MAVCSLEGIECLRRKGKILDALGQFRIIFKHSNLLAVALVQAVARRAVALLGGKYIKVEGGREISPVPRRVLGYGRGFAASELHAKHFPLPGAPACGLVVGFSADLIHPVPLCHVKRSARDGAHLFAVCRIQVVVREPAALAGPNKPAVGQKAKLSLGLHIGCVGFEQKQGGSLAQGEGHHLHGVLVAV